LRHDASQDGGVLAVQSTGKRKVKFVQSMHGVGRILLVGEETLVVLLEQLSKPQQAKI
jgi:hypothetical protein